MFNFDMDVVNGIVIPEEPFAVQICARADVQPDMDVVNGVVIPEEPPRGMCLVSA